ncbi:MAG: hypothetical protein K2F81_00980 [Ruminococcus sp.]|nr:hypothetical protein [Ruminococcus sp.]
MEIYKVKNYKKFADELKEKTGCNVDVKILGRDHFHYQLSKDGLSLGILCVDKGEASFAPFVTHETAKNDNYLNLQFLPLFDEFTLLLSVFKDMFVE